MKCRMRGEIAFKSSIIKSSSYCPLMLVALIIWEGNQQEGMCLIVRQVYTCMRAKHRSAYIICIKNIILQYHCRCIATAIFVQWTMCRQTIISKSITSSRNRILNYKIGEKFSWFICFKIVITSWSISRSYTGSNLWFRREANRNVYFVLLDKSIHAGQTAISIYKIDYFMLQYRCIATAHFFSTNNDPSESIVVA